MQLGDFARMKQYYEEQMLELRKLGGETMPVADALLSLAWVAGKLGDLAKAENYAREALGISQAEAPKSAETIVGLQTLGYVLLDRGDPVAATEYEHQALDNLERYFPKSDRLAEVHLAQVLGGLGLLAPRRGEFRRARTYYQRALAVAEMAARGNPARAYVGQALVTLLESLMDQC